MVLKNLFKIMHLTHKYKSCTIGDVDKRIPRDAIWIAATVALLVLFYWIIAERLP